MAGSYRKQKELMIYQKQTARHLETYCDLHVYVNLPETAQAEDDGVNNSKEV